MFKGDIVVAAMIFHFPVQHFSGNAKDDARLVVHNQAISWDVIQRFLEFGALHVGQVLLTQRRIRNAARIAHHGRRDAIKLVILRQRFFGDLLPLAKAHQHMRFHRVVRLQRPRQLRYFRAQDVFGQ